MNVNDAKTLYDKHIRNMMHPLIHIYSDYNDERFSPIETKVYVLEKERRGKDIDSIVSVKKYDAIDIAKVLQTSNHMVSMVNSDGLTIKHLIRDGLLNHSNTINPEVDTQLKQVGPVGHNFYFYTHEMISGIKPIKSQEV